MFKKNLNQILSSFSKTIAQLEQLQARNSAAVEANHVTVSRLTAENTDLNTESGQANRVAEKLRAILE